MNAPRQSPRSLPLVLMLLVVVLPGVIALTLYLSGWRPHQVGGHGEFLQPPAPLDGITLMTAEGAVMPLHRLRGKWSLLYLPPAACDSACVATLYGMRMAHLAQGKEQARVRRLVVSLSADLGRALRGKDGDLLTLTGTAAQRAELLAHLRDNATQAHIYLIDPLGNAILRYPQDVDPSGIRKDLTHLLKHSWVG